MKKKKSNEKDAEDHFCVIDYLASNKTAPV